MQEFICASTYEFVATFIVAVLLMKTADDRLLKKLIGHRPFRARYICVKRSRVALNSYPKDHFSNTPNRLWRTVYGTGRIRTRVRSEFMTYMTYFVEYGTIFSRIWNIKCAKFGWI